jgi:hypothetical protein
VNVCDSNRPIDPCPKMFDCNMHVRLVETHARCDYDPYIASVYNEFAYCMAAGKWDIRDKQSINEFFVNLTPKSTSMGSPVGSSMQRTVSFEAEPLGMKIDRVCGLWGV